MIQEIWDEALTPMGTIEDAVIKWPAQTFTGLAVKARIARSVLGPHETEQFELPESDMDWHVLALHRLFEDIERLAAAGRA